MYSGINGYQTTNGDNIPVTMAVTDLKSNIVIVNDKGKTVEICELTVPFESNNKARNTFKKTRINNFQKT